MDTILDQRVRWQRGLLAVERLASALFVPLTVLIGGAVVIGLGGFEALLPSLRAMVWAICLSAWLVAVVLGFHDWRWPTAVEARARLEEGVAHQPVSAAIDDLAGDLAEGTREPLAHALWQQHRAASLAEAVRLPLRGPRLGVSLWHKKAAVTMGCGLLVLMTWPGNPTRSHWQTAMTLTSGVGHPPKVALWITPPAYAGMPILHRVSGEADSPLRVPAGSRLVVLLTGGPWTVPPRGGVAGQALPLEKAVGDNQAESYRAEMTLEPGVGRLRVTAHGRPLVDWPLAVQVDQPPTVALGDPAPVPPPRPADKASSPRLRVAVAASDDFGLKALTLVITLDPAFALADDTPHRLRVSLPEGQGQPLTGYHETVAFDLTGDAWSGLPVRLQWLAVDSKGQSSLSESVGRVLPERSFKTPLAMALGHARREVLDHWGQPHRATATEIEALSHRLGGFQGDLGVFLGLRVAAYRLASDRGVGVERSVAALLWDLAVRVEEGGMGSAKAALDAALLDLKQALSNASGRDVQAAIAAVRQATGRLAAEMAQQMARQRANQPSSPSPNQQPTQPGGFAVPPNQQSIQPGGFMTPPGMAGSSLKQLDKDLQRLAELAALGDKAAALALAQRLEQQLNALRDATPVSSEALAEANRLAHALEAIIAQQRETLNSTFALKQGNLTTDLAGGQAAGDPSGNQSGVVASQDGIRTRLLEVITDIAAKPPGKVPDGLVVAEKAMKEAAAALAKANFETALRRQGQAIEALTKGGREAVSAAVGGGVGGGSLFMLPGDASGEASGGARERGLLSGESGEGSDPLGRERSGMVDVNGQPIPEGAEVNHARDLLDELRRRAGEPDRPPSEHDYLQRLLDGL